MTDKNKKPVNTSQDSSSAVFPDSGRKEDVKSSADIKSSDNKDHYPDGIPPGVEWPYTGYGHHDRSTWI